MLERASPFGRWLYREVNMSSLQFERMLNILYQEVNCIRVDTPPSAGELFGSVEAVFLSRGFVVDTSPLTMIESAIRRGVFRSYAFSRVFRYPAGAEWHPLFLVGYVSTTPEGRTCLTIGFKMTVVLLLRWIQLVGGIVGVVCVVALFVGTIPFNTRSTCLLATWIAFLVLTGLLPRLIWKYRAPALSEIFCALNVR
jgi:hypothetical protein